MQRRFVFQVYGRFGRVLREFPIGDELHHHAAEKARVYAAERQAGGTDCWVRLV